MRTLQKTLLGTVGALMLTSASHAAVVGPAATAQTCAAFTFSGATELNCAGGYQGNLQQGSPVDALALSALQALGYTGTGVYVASQKIEGITGSDLSFTNFVAQMSGLTIIGIHYGAAGVKPEATSFFSFDAGNGTSKITVTGRDGTQPNYGLSNAILYQTGRPVGVVPEPATWAMMLFGFGAVGLSFRGDRRRRLGKHGLRYSKV